MTNGQFKSFREIVETANEHDDIWWAGYLWLDLSKRQADEMRKLLKVHPSIVKAGEKLMMPSGMYMHA